MKKALKVSLFILGGLLVLLLLVMFIAPPVAKNYVEQHDETLLGRELNVGGIGVNLFTGKLKIKDLTLFEEDGTTPFMQFDRLETKVKLWELVQHCVWVKQAKISGLKVNVEQNRSWFNFNSLLEHFASDKSKKESSDYSLVIKDINLEKGTIRYADLAVGSEFLLRDISLRIPSIDFSDLKTDVGLDLCLSEETTLHTDLRLSDNAKKYFITLKLNKLGIEIIEPYLQQHYPVDLLGGLIGLDVEAQGPTDHILDFNMNGTMVLNDVAFRDTQGNPLGEVDSVYAEIQRFSLSDKVLDFEKLHFVGLHTSYIIKADSTNNFDLLSNHGSQLDSTEVKMDTVFVDKENDKLWNINVADLNFDASQVKFEDYRLPKPFYYDFSDIRLSSRYFTYRGDNTVQLQAALNKVGKLHLNWRGRFHRHDNHNLTLMLSNVKVTDFSPYSEYLFGFPIEDGTLSLRSQNIVLDDSVHGINKLQLASPKIGNKIKRNPPKYTKVPLKLGLYLLADKHNNVSLDLPVSGNLNDPDFSYADALRKAFSNLLTKVSSAPFRLMTDEDNNLKYIPFDPLQFDFTPEQYVMIDNLAVTLQNRSDLGIVLEEQVQYEEVVKQLCVIQLQRDYYLSIHPEMKKGDIDFMTNEAIRSIKLNDKGLCDFAKQYSEKKRLRSAKDVESVACAVYWEKSEKLLPKLMEIHNEQLSNYLLNVKGLSPEQISVTTIDESLMKTFVKPSRYEMHVLTYEEME